MKTARFNKTTLCLGLMTLIILTACEVDTKVAVTTEFPPTFVLSGNGSLAQLYVSGPMTLDELKLVAGQQAVTVEEMNKIKQVIGTDRILWQIDPGEVRKIVSDLAPITYGTVPKGFKQVVPKDGTPQILLEGRYYCVSAPSHNAGNRETYFLIKDGKAIEISLDRILKSSR